MGTLSELITFHLEVGFQKKKVGKCEIGSTQFLENLFPNLIHASIIHITANKINYLADPQLMGTSKLLSKR
jgi:hypothetical protein